MNIKQPFTLTLITTFKCTASCKECCFECNPQRIERMSLDEMKSYCRSAVEFYPSIKLVVLTGGECMMLGNDLYDIIFYINTLGVKSRIVTNAYWARDFRTAYKCLSKLKEYGLTEINFSTGDDHQEFVSFDNIKNAVRASLELGMITCVNIETRDDRKFNVSDFLNDVELKRCLESNKRGLLHVIAGTWMPFTEDSLRKLPPKDIKKHTVQCGRCENLFESINIMPNKDVVACCGLASRYVGYLQLGSLEQNSMKELYEKQFCDFLKIWLFVDGPYKILEFVERKIAPRKVPELYVESHMCFYCACLYSNSEYMHIVQENYLDVYNSVMMKYILSNKKKSYEKAK